MWFVYLVSSLFRNHVLIGAISAWLVAQVLKVIIELIRHKELSLKRLFGDGGMPSGHSACVMGLATSCAITYGFSSFEFAISGVLAVIVMHDATGVRQESGKQAHAINELREILKPIYNDVTDEHLKELLGHNHLQVLGGALLGIIVGTLTCMIWPS